MKFRFDQISRPHRTQNTSRDEEITQRTASYVVPPLTCPTGRAGKWGCRVECLRMCSWDVCVGFNRGSVPGELFSPLELNGKKWELGDMPDSRLGGRGGGEQSLGGSTGASGACLIYKHSNT